MTEVEMTDLVTVGEAVVPHDLKDTEGEGTMSTQTTKIEQLESFNW